MCVGLSLLNLWPIFETDLFHHLRAGEDILTRGHIYSQDEWSHTARGAVVFNFEWLSNVLVRIIYDFFGFAGLSVLRSGILFVWLLSIVALIARTTIDTRTRTLLALTLLPWCFFMVAYRFHMRPDSLAALVFATLVMFWSGPWQVSFQRFALVSIGLLILWANLHAGTVPIGIGGTLAYLVFVRTESWRIKVGLGLLVCGTLFATPLHFNILRVLGEAVLHYNHATLGNPDHTPFKLEFLDWREGTWSIFWIPFFLIWVIGILKMFPTRIFEKRSMYSDLSAEERRIVFYAFFGTALLGLYLQKMRAIHYHVLFCLPVAANLIGTYLINPKHKKGLPRLLPFVVLLWCVTLFVHALSQTRPLGTGVWAREVPIGNAEFLRRHSPAGNILNEFAFGGYLILTLPNYPVSFDGRELQYSRFKQQMTERVLAMNEDPQSFEKFLDQHSIGIVLVRFPTFVKLPDEEIQAQLEFPIAKSRWALVSIDNSSVLFLRRNEGNGATISRYEYTLVKPGLAIDLALNPNRVSSANIGELTKEVDRCNENQDKPVSYCLILKAALSLIGGYQSEFNRYLDLALKADPFSRDGLRLKIIANERAGNSVEAIWNRIRLTFIAD